MNNSSWMIHNDDNSQEDDYEKIVSFSTTTLEKRNQSMVSIPHEEHEQPPKSNIIQLEALLRAENATNQRKNDDDDYQCPIIWNDYNVAWRKQACQWAFRLVDHFRNGGNGNGNFDRSIVHAMMGILDRHVVYTARISHPPIKQEYEMMAIASLCLAMSSATSTTASRSYVDNTIGSDVYNDVIMLSKSRYPADKIHVIAQYILSSPVWVPITAPNEILQHLIAFLPPNLPYVTKDNILDKATFFTEVCIMNFSTTCHPASIIAVSSLIHAIDCILSSTTARCNTKGSAINFRDKEDFIATLRKTFLCRILDDNESQIQEIKFYLKAYFAHEIEPLTPKLVLKKRKERRISVEEHDEAEVKRSRNQQKFDSTRVSSTVDTFSHHTLIAFKKEVDLLLAAGHSFDPTNNTKKTTTKASTFGIIQNVEE